MKELHICKYCGVETTQIDEECYAKPNKELTAVEWLKNKLNEEEIIIYHGLFNMWIKQALEMEKQHKIDFANNYGFDICGYDYERAEQYYNETYKKEKCICKNAELEKDSLVPVYCHNCNVYIQQNL